jgi:hypothetical protein
MAYLDNIIIYSITEEEHREYVKWVLKRLQEEQIPVAVKKYYISMDLKKVKAIVD